MYNANLNSRVRPHFEYVKSTILVFRSFLEFPASLVLQISAWCLFGLRKGEQAIRRFAP